jgi:hypothetical protein
VWRAHMRGYKSTAAEAVRISPSSVRVRITVTNGSGNLIASTGSTHQALPFTAALGQPPRVSRTQSSGPRNARNGPPQSVCASRVARRPGSQLWTRCRFAGSVCREPLFCCSEQGGVPHMPASSQAMRRSQARLQYLHPSGTQMHGE